MRHRGLVVLAVAEIGFLAANGPYALAPAVTIASTNPETAQLAALTGSQGNYALYDPHFYVAPSTEPIAEELGLFDLGILHHISSVQGYGSIVSLLYEDATASHAVGNFDLQALAGSTGNVLDLHTLLTSPQYLAQSIPDHGAIPILTEDGPRFDIGTGERVLRGQAPAQTGPWFILPGTERTWFLPGIVKGRVGHPRARSDRAPATRRRSPSPSSTPAVNRSARQQRCRGTRALAVSAAGLRRGRGPRQHAQGRLTAVLGGVVVANRSGSGRILLDGILQTALSAPHWRFAGMVGPLPAFTNTESRGPTWVVGSTSAEPGRAAACRARPRQRLRLPSETLQEPSSRSPTPALLVRSTAFAPDWYAEVAPESGGPSDLVPVRALGVVQAVPVPAGHFVVTWVYRPGTARLGALSSFVATLVFLALCALAWFRRRARAASGTVA